MATAPAPRWQRLTHDERRAQILDCARRLFSERQYDAVSTIEVAREAGVTRGLLHHYFGTKRELYLEVVRTLLRGGEPERWPCGHFSGPGQAPRVPGVLIRHADPIRDAVACTAIYSPYVTDGVASLEEHAPGTPEMRARIETISARYPWLVAEREEAVVGYAYATEHRARAAYRWATETTVYVSSSHHRGGVGRALYGTLLPLLRRQGFYLACAGITLPNDASVALHESFGFEPIGVYRGIGFKHGSWHATGWWLAELRQQLPGETPAEPGPPARLGG